MKKAFSVILLSLTATAFSQVRWMTLEEAISAQSANPKKILISFYSSGNSAGDQSGAQPFDNAQIIAETNQNYYPVRFDVDSGQSYTFGDRTFSSSYQNNIPMHSFAKFMNVTTTPSVVFVDEKGMPIMILNGSVSPKELDPYLRLMASENYSKIDSRQKWNDLQGKLKSTIKD